MPIQLTESEYSDACHLWRTVVSGNAHELKKCMSPKWRTLNGESMAISTMEQGDWDSLEGLGVIYAFRNGGWTLHTPLSLAVATKDFDVAEVLLRDQRLDPNVHLTDHWEEDDDSVHFQDSSETSLGLAISNQSLQLINLLLDYGANPIGYWGDVANSRFESLEDEITVIRTLLRFGAPSQTAIYEYLSGLNFDTESIEAEVQTSDILARIDEVLKTLKVSGATLNAPIDEVNAVHLAARHPALLRCIKKHYDLAPIPNCNVPALLSSHLCPATINLLVRDGHDPFARDLYGNTVLHRWVMGMPSEFESEFLGIEDQLVPVSDSFYVLVGLGVDVNAANKIGMTALHVACLLKKPEAVRRLLENGADADQKNNRNETPMFYAFAEAGFRRSRQDAPEYLDFDEAQQLKMIATLLKHGANWDVQNANGTSLLKFAASATDAAFEAITKVVPPEKIEWLTNQRQKMLSARTVFLSNIIATDVADISYYGQFDFAEQIR